MLHVSEGLIKFLDFHEIVRQISNDTIDIDINIFTAVRCCTKKLVGHFFPHVKSETCFLCRKTVKYYISKHIVFIFK